jgi:ribosomal protein S18 acetylase RimI-like enzyme
MCTNKDNMDIEIKPLSKRDFNIARKYAIEGMHLSWYAKKGIELYLYSKYFWYLEISRATKCYSAYYENKLAGVLLAEINNEQKLFKSLWYKLYVKIISFFINIGYKASSTYDDANKEMYNELKQKHKLDGEINFLAVDPKINGKGIGTLLLNQLENEEKGKRIYLYTDSGSTYQFYEKRGFRRENERNIKLDIHNKEVELKCLIYSKIMGRNNNG